MGRTAAVAFTLSVDGVTIGTQLVSVRSPVSGATGNTGRASLTVTVKS
jgi:hypothetical protein